MKHRAFTLLELLIVVAIIALLAGMAMPMLNMAREAARASATRSVMARVDGALRQFKADYLVYPHQSAYADVDAGEFPGNRLAYHLGTNLSSAQRDLVMQDMASAAAAYAYTFGNDRADGAHGPLAYLRNDVTTEGGNVPASVVALNRMAQERVRLRVLSGDTSVGGAVIRRSDGSIVRDLRAVRALPTAMSAASTGPGPGWAVDYLAGELESKTIDGQRILDGWKRPLAYVCQVAPGCRPTSVLLYRNTSTLTRLGLYDLDPQQRTVLRNGNAVDAAFLPDPGNLMHSDRRHYAAPGFEREFELWSCGRDGRLGWMRDDLRNRDNLGLVDYDAGIR